MCSFANLLSRLTFLNEAAPSPMERLMPGFQKQARELAASKLIAGLPKPNPLALYVG